MIKVVYWSSTGNTEQMAESIVKGIQEAGKEAELLNLSDISVDDVKDEDVFALGCPAMGAENLEEGEVEPFVTELEQYAAGKTILLFGSYSWGDGQWMRDWVERLANCGTNILNNEGFICCETPSDEVLAQGEELGKQLAQI